MKIICSMYRAVEVSVPWACCERATQSYLFGGGSTIYSGSRPAGVTTCSPTMVIECLLTRSMLIKMYKFTVSWYVPVYVIVFTVSHSVYLVFQIAWMFLFATTILSESMNIELSLQWLSSLASPFSPSCPPLTCWRSTHQYCSRLLMSAPDSASSIWDFFQTGGPYWLGEGPY